MAQAPEALLVNAIVPTISVDDLQKSIAFCFREDGANDEHRE